MSQRAGNSPAVWDSLWEKHRQDHRDTDSAKLLRWYRETEKVILANRGTFKNVRSLELGAGSGNLSAVFARHGARVSVLDYSDKALGISRAFFRSQGLSASFEKADALRLPKRLCGKFDVSMSFGLAEHFAGEDRIRVIRAHFQALKRGGLAVISVPNALCPAYRVFKMISEAKGTWEFGLEIPFTRRELFSVGREVGFQNPKIFGSSFLSSFELVNPVRVLRRMLKLPPNLRTGREFATPLDDYFGSALVYVAEKPLD